MTKQPEIIRREFIRVIAEDFIASNIINETILDRKVADEILKEVAGKLGILNLPTYAGEGYNGIAYISGDKVYKLTIDPTEAIEALKIKGKRNKLLADVYQVYEIDKRGVDKKIFLIICEKLTVDPTKFDSLFESLDEILKGRFGHKFFAVAFVDMATSKPKVYDYFAPDIENVLNNHPNEKHFYNSLLNIAKELKSNNMDSLDLSANNLGYKKNGQIGFFDYGMTGDDSKPNADVLALENKVVDEAVEDIERHLQRQDTNINDFAAKVANKLGYTIVKNFGKGTQGYAFDIGNNKILKITSDKGEAIEASRLVGKNTKHIGRFYGSYRLNEPNDKIYIIVREKLEVDPERVVDIIADFMGFMDLSPAGWSEVSNMIKNGDRPKFNQIVKNATKIQDAQIKRHVGLMLAVIKELMDNGVRSADFTEDNFGYRNGVLAYYDLGYSAHKEMDSVGLLTLENAILERVMSYMPNAKAVGIKKKCQINGNGDGTSTACNQGDINAIVTQTIKEELNKLSEIDAYHGTSRNSNFNAFSLKKIGSSDGRELGGWGFYFTNDPQVASIYGDKIMNVRLRDGRYLNFDETIDDHVASYILSRGRNAGLSDSDVEQFQTDFYDESYRYDITNKQVYEWLAAVLGSNKAASQFLSKAGYVGNMMSDKTNPDATNYIVFDPTSIKIIDDGDEMYEALNENSAVSAMKAKLESLKSQFAEAGQKIYNEWEQDHEGYDEMYGSGGICDDIADEMCDVVSRNSGYGCFTRYSEYECHTSIYVYDTPNKILMHVDISPYNYETGGGYTWKKIPDVRFQPEMVEIQDMSGYWDEFFDEDGEVTEISESLIKEILSEAERKEKVEFGVLMLDFEITNWEEITSMIEKDDIYDEPTFGIEKDPHVTILYGFHSEVDANQVRAIVESIVDISKPIEIELKEVSHFETPDFDVVKFDVVPTGTLKKLNKALKELPYTNRFKDYHPHMTISYVKKGTGKKYGKKFKKNIKLQSDKLIFSTKDNKKTVLKPKKGKINENIANIDMLPFKNDIELAGGKIYSVGGAVRDGMLNKPSKDLDLLITGVPLEDIEKILSKYGRVDNVGKSFGIIKFTTPQTGELDIAVPRTERATGQGGYQGFEVTSDHTLPIEKDLERRDFTINAIAKDSHGQVIDPYGGSQDIKDKLIRMVNPKAFSEDPLRMLRAVQFASRFDFKIEPETLKAIQQNASKIREISPERILIEFDKIVKKGKPAVGAQLLQETGLYQQIFSIDSPVNVAEFNNVKTMGEFIYQLTKYGIPNPAEFYKNSLKGDLTTYNEMKALELAFRDDSDNAVKNKLTVFNMYKVYPNSINSEIIPDKIKDNIKEMRSMGMPFSLRELQVNGNDLLPLGYSGKQIGDILKKLLLDIYSGKQRNNKEILLRQIVPQEPQ